MKKAMKAALLAGLTAMSTQAPAAMIVRDYLVAGDGLLTYDEATGLEWLDVGATKGFSVTGALAAHQGFDLATAGQVGMLLTNMGFNHVGYTFDGITHANDLAAGILFTQTLGYTLSAFGGAVIQVYGHVKNPDPGYYDQWVMEIRQSPATPIGVSNYLSTLHNCYQCSSSNEGNFLVRAGAVPEPATWLMMIAGFGLVGSTLRARRTEIRFA